MWFRHGWEQPQCSELITGCSFAAEGWSLNLTRGDGKPRGCWELWGGGSTPQWRGSTAPPAEWSGSGASDAMSAAWDCRPAVGTAHMKRKVRCHISFVSCLGYAAHWCFHYLEWQGIFGSCRCIYSSVVVLSYSYYILVWTLAQSSLVVLNLNLMKRPFQKSLDFWWCSNCFPPIDSCISTCWVMLTIFLYYISLENEKKYSLQSPIHDDDVLDNQNKLKLIHFVCPKHHILMIGDSRMWVSATSSFYPESLKK